MDNTVRQAGFAPEAGGIQQGEKAGIADARVLGGELVMMLSEGMRTGDVDRGFPEEIARLIEMGAGPHELADALKQAAQRARISPLMLARAERLLGAGPAGDEPVDRSQVLSRRRNQLAQ
jgi:hypothetical protein